ncbi:MAG: NAD-dependent epimerase/dehydratase family protein [Desulfobacterales bacterium]
MVRRCGSTAAWCAPSRKESSDARFHNRRSWICRPPSVPGAAGRRPRGDGQRPLENRTDNRYPRFQYVAADTTQEGPWQETAKQADAAVNLAGVSIFSYWTDSHKQRMVDSRILTTRNLVNALLDGNAKVLCSTSAVGYYGHQGEEKLTEEHPPGDDFLARLAGTQNTVYTPFIHRFNVY